MLDAESELFNSATQEATARGNEIVGAYRLYALAGQFLPVLNIDDKSLRFSAKVNLPSNLSALFPGLCPDPPRALPSGPRKGQRP